jgi:hypothetical protein
MNLNCPAIDPQHVGTGTSSIPIKTEGSAADDS